MKKAENQRRKTRKQPRVTRNETRATDSALESRVCENCRHSIPAGDRKAAILTCRNNEGATGRLCIVAPEEGCENFTKDHEIIDPEYVRALAEGAKLIPLTQDKFAIVDADDYDHLNKFNWYAINIGQTFYARSQRPCGIVTMHRVILNAPSHLVVDHINHNGLDNRKRNLRLCTKAQNNYNKLPSPNCTSRFKGVYWDKYRNRFAASIWHKGKKYFLGRFISEIDAAKAYDKKAKELFGEFAYLNFPNDS